VKRQVRNGWKQLMNEAMENETRKNMKKVLTIVLTVLMVICLGACSNKTETVSEETSVSENTEPVKEENVESGETQGKTETEGKVLVAYFSATGTTKGVAEKIAKLTNGDLYEIVPAEAYSDADLNWNDSNSRSTKEQNDKSVRPGIGSETLDLSGYTTIYLGFPIWWGEEPRILDTFVESYNFDGITMIPFCTSSSSGIGRSGPNMEELAKSGTWLEGRRFAGSVSEADLQTWIDGLN